MRVAAMPWRRIGRPFHHKQSRFPGCRWPGGRPAQYDGLAPAIRAVHPEPGAQGSPQRPLAASRRRVFAAPWLRWLSSCVEEGGETERDARASW